MFLRSLRSLTLVLVAGVLAAGFLAGPAGAAVVEVTVTVAEGDLPPGAAGPVDNVNAPFTDGNGTVGFTGSLDINGSADTFVWFDTGIVWLGSDEPLFDLSGGEGTMGISNAGGYIYSPSADGNDAVWTQNGALLIEGSPAPGFDPPTSNVFNSRPTMTPSGTAHWIAGYDLEGGGSSDGRVVYRSVDGLPENIEVVLRPGDLFDGFEVEDGSGVDFDYSFSDDASHHIQPLQMVTGNIANDNFIFVDGTLVARESEPTGDGDNWDNFDAVSINDRGDYLFSGDTDGDGSSDEFIAYNAAVELREGDTVGGFTLTSSASVQALSLNNLGQAAHQWNTPDGEVLFHSCSASDLGANSVVVLAEGDEIDTDGNGLGEATVVDLNATGVVGPGLSLAENGRLFVGVDLDDGITEYEAILELDVSSLCGGGPQLEVSGSCPGEVTLSVSGGTPSGTVALLRGSGAGSDPLPAGPCAGLFSGLDGLALVGPFGLDGAGNLNVTPTVPDAGCGLSVQVVDIANCLFSSVEMLP